MAPPRPNKKRRIAPAAPADNTPLVPITSLKQLQDSILDHQGPGLRQVRNFLNTCLTTPENPDSAASVQRKILAQYLETQCRRAHASDAAETADENNRPVAFADFSATWSYAFQNNSQHLMTMVPACLSILVRVCSQNEELRKYGETLVRTLLQQTNLKIIYRSLTGNKEHHISPCLRLLTEMVRFDFGGLAAEVQRGFDFTIKDLTRSFEIRSGKVEEEEPGKPSVRTMAVRFYLSFLQMGEAATRTEMLGLRTWVSAVFKNIKLDTPQVVVEILECMRKQVLAEKEIPRATKTNVFNDWVLGHVLSLYGREEKVVVYNAGKEEEKTVAKVAHDFLMETCTTVGNGVCFPDQGWYPPGMSAGEGEDKRKNAKVFNRTLAAFITNIRPYADTQQLDLILAIFKACPELVADYFLTNTVFIFDPKLTATWIGYSNFLLQTACLPVPPNFGSKKDILHPPPVEIVLENIIPKPISKTVATKCLSSPISLIRFLTTKLLIAAFRKLRGVLSQIDAIAATLEDRDESWLKHRLAVVEEFCRRIPDITLITSLISAKNQPGILQSEAQTKLLAEYYTVTPEVANAGKFDINVALTAYLDREVDDDKKAFNLLELSHLLQVANETPDAKWWHKTPGMKHSPFVSILKLCCSSASGAPLAQVRQLLHNFAKTSYLFQSETSVSTLDALLESLANVKDWCLEPVLTLLDEVIGRCVRTPFKYLDDFAELAISLEKGAKGKVEVAPVSPLVMTLVEQWKFFAKNDKITADQKMAGARWLRRFLDSCALLGENGKVLAALCERLEEETEDKSIKTLFKQLRKELRGEMKVLLGVVPETMDLAGARSLVDEAVVVDAERFGRRMEELKHQGTEVSLFQLAAAQKAMGDVARSEGKVETVRKAVEEAGVLARTVVSLLGQRSEEVTNVVREFVEGEIRRVEEVLPAVSGEGKLPVLVELFQAYAGLLEAAFEESEPGLEKAKDVLLRTMAKSWELCDGQTELTEKLVTAYRTVAGLAFTTEDTDKLMETLSSSSSQPAQDLAAFLVRRAAERSEVLATGNITKILAGDVSPALSAALVIYIKGADAENLSGIELDLGSDSPAKTDVECALITKLASYQKSALKFYNKKIKAGKLLPMFASRFAALLEAYSGSGDAKGKYSWDNETPEATRAALQALYDAVQDQLLEDDLDMSQVEVFLRAASLFESVDRKRVLDHVAGTKKRNTLKADTVNLIDILTTKSTTFTQPSMKHFLVLSFDQLIRKLSDPSGNISESTTAFVERLSTFLSVRKAPVASVVPAGMINTLFTAILTHHVATPSTTSLLITLLALVPGKLLEIKRFLQMLLAHPDNPLGTRGGIYHMPDNLQRQTAYLLHTLFWNNPDAASSLVTMDSILELYRGTDDPVDRVLLAMLTHIEGYLTRSVATRITNWSLTDHLDTTSHPLISRQRGRLALTISSRVLQKSSQNFNPSPPPLDLTTLDSFLSTPLTATRNYDPSFILPVLAYMLHTTSAIDTPTFLSKHCLAFTIATLSHSSPLVLNSAVALLTSIRPLIKTSSIRTKTQLHHHLSALLFSLPDPPTPLPTLTAVLHASISTVLQNPAHVMYPRTIQYLLRQPLLDLFDLPLLLAPSEIGGEEELKNQGEHEKELGWVLNILVNGCRKPEDVEILRKRNVVDIVLGMGEKAEELMWNMAGVEGAATTLITRSGVMGWAQSRMARGGEKEREKVQRVLGRLVLGVDREYVAKWSRGLWGGEFVEGALRPEGLSV